MSKLSRKLVARDNEGTFKENNNTENKNEEPVNLTNCEVEPIHIPGAIQPHGMLLVLTEPNLEIAQVSENSQEIVGIAPVDMLARPLADFIGDQQVNKIDSCLKRNFEQVNPLPLSFTLEDGSSQSFNGIVHRSRSGEIVLELEPLDPSAKQDFVQFYDRIKDTLAKIQKTPNLRELCDLIVREIKEITGFDRVMVYRFDDKKNGSVIAEAKQLILAPFLGLHYPAADIPQEARQLYELNWLRLIPDVNYQPSKLFFTEQSSPEESCSLLDMSYCVLRSVSPIHIEYMQNMGVSATMVISLIHDRQLWGLIACHHNSPKFVPYEIRTVCEFLGQLMSTEIAGKEANENLDYKLQLKKIQAQCAARLTGAKDFVTELEAIPERFLTLTGAKGAAVCEGDDIKLVGKTPDKAQITSLLSWLNDRWDRDLFVTNALSSLYADAEAYKQVASGLLAVAISQIQDRYVLWFRPEFLQTVTWAGNPEVPTRVEVDGSVTLGPRQSFAAWQEIVRGQSRAWLECEIDEAIELRQTIVDISLVRQAKELARINIELERSNRELDSFAYIASHDLKEPLRGIHNYATFLLEDYEDILEEDGAEKLNTLVRLTKRMESLIESLLKFSRLGRQELQMQRIDLNQSLQDTIEMFGMNPQWEGCNIRQLKPLPTVWGDRVLVEEIFTNLISNGLKYNKNVEKWVEIGWRQSSNQTNGMAMLYVRDNGIGIREKHQESVFRIFKRLHPPGKYGGGTGAGLTIVKKIVERHGGTIQVESTYGQGTTFWFTLPMQKTIALV